jgi:pyruvate dehydrogenase E1 component beta subunit
VQRALAAAESLAGEGISAEVVDLRTISPLDTGAILRSLEKTGRIVIVHDAVGPFGGGAEVAAVAASEGFHALRAPVRRVTAPFAPVPLGAALETAYYPQSDDIADAVREVLA